MLVSLKHRIATIMRSPATTKRLLLLLWAAFIIRGLWYSAAMPIWEGYDEPYHFAYLQQLAAGRDCPQVPMEFHSRCSIPCTYCR